MESVCWDLLRPEAMAVLALLGSPSLSPWHYHQAERLSPSRLGIWLLLVPSPGEAPLAWARSTSRWCHRSRASSAAHWLRCLPLPVLAGQPSAWSSRCRRCLRRLRRDGQSRGLCSHLVNNESPGAS